MQRMLKKLIKILIFLFIIFQFSNIITNAIFISKDYWIFDKEIKKYYNWIWKKLIYKNSDNFNKVINIFFNNNTKKILFYSILKQETNYNVIWKPWNRLKEHFNLKECWLYYNFSNESECLKRWINKNECSVCFINKKILWNKWIFWINNKYNLKQQKIFLDWNTSYAKAIWPMQFLPYNIINIVKNYNIQEFYKYPNSIFSIMKLVNWFFSNYSTYHRLSSNPKLYLKCNNYLSNKFNECKIIRKTIFKYNRSTKYINSIINYMNYYYLLDNLNIIWNPITYWLDNTNNLVYNNINNFMIINRKLFNYWNLKLIWFWNIENRIEYNRMKKEKILVQNIIDNPNNCYYIPKKNFKNTFAYRKMWNTIICFKYINKNWNSMFFTQLYTLLSDKTEKLIKLKYKTIPYSYKDWANKFLSYSLYNNIRWKKYNFKNFNKIIKFKNILKFNWIEKWDFIWIIWKKWLWISYFVQDYNIPFWRNPNYFINNYFMQIIKNQLINK